MNKGLITVMLIACMAAAPSDGRSRPRAFITKLEKAKKTPPTRPEPTAVASVSANSSPSISIDPRRFVPDARRGRLPRELREVARRAAERPLDAVREHGVAAVEHLAEQVGEEPDDLLGLALLPRSGLVLLERHRHVPDLATGGGGDLPHRLLERDHPRPGQLVDLAFVALLGQRQRANVRDVLDVDERLRDGGGGQDDLTRRNLLGEEALAEVLAEPAAA